MAGGHACGVMGGLDGVEARGFEEASGTRVVILNLDLTLWDHPDISRTRPPYQPVGDDAILDSAGVRIRLRECARSFLEDARRRGVVLAIASWNEPEPALAALEAFRIIHYFSYVVVEPHPCKERMVEQILRAAGVRPAQAVFIDDNPYIVNRVKARYGEMPVLQFGVDVRSFCELDVMLFR